MAAILKAAILVVTKQRSLDMEKFYSVSGNKAVRQDNFQDACEHVNSKWFPGLSVSGVVTLQVRGSKVYSYCNGVNLESISKKLQSKLQREIA